MTLIVIIAVMALTVAFTGMCSLNPGRPENGPVQEVDARQFLDIEARGMAFPLRYPQMPDGWTTNSARRSSVDGAPAPVVGWVTAQGAYVQLLQTDRPLEDAVKDHDDYARKEQTSTSIAGADVHVYTSEEHDARVLWVADLGDVRLLVSGTAGETEYTQLMEATLKTAPIDAHRP